MLVNLRNVVLQGLDAPCEARPDEATMGVLRVKIGWEEKHQEKQTFKVFFW